MNLMKTPDNIRVDLLAEQESKNGEPLFGKLTVIGFGGRHKNTTFWVCKCNCGHVGSYMHGNLRSGKSTGCVKCAWGGARTHGRSNTSTYRSWAHLIKNGDFPDRWKDFQNFYQDMGVKPSGLYLCRRVVSNPHGAKNSFWGTLEESLKARGKKGRSITVNGETKTIVQWAKKLGISRQSMHKRLQFGWSEQEAVTIPKVFPYNRNKK